MSNNFLILNSSELRFLQYKIVLLKEANQNQNIEIFLLKEIFTESHQGLKEKLKDVNPGGLIIKRKIASWDVQQPAIRMLLYQLLLYQRGRISP